MTFSSHHQNDVYSYHRFTQRYCRIAMFRYLLESHALLHSLMSLSFSVSVFLKINGDISREADMIMKERGEKMKPSEVIAHSERLQTSLC